MIHTLDQLRALYPPPGERAVRKELTHLDAHCRHFITLSPFLVVASSNAQGQHDASPRGGAPGFVQVSDAHTLYVPDASGNNRLDTLTNLLETGRVALLFLIPGVDETLRVNGRACLRDEPEVLSRFQDAARPPKVVIEVQVEQAYLHCAKALMRAELWNPELQRERSELPTLGQMLKDQLQLSEEPESQEAMVARYRETL
ncbi:hypothetical protein SAMN05421823_11172 [Catalinimonas alkaloidigena]|uniref:Pyridoxamine 5'-phosphate oxidase N-terminal domain-containing protein n=1 Tax=Catalinimonas alkaloidigena TaxID=1075417 RepID=A0A1G9R8D6_9BACT|nr:pyridoxamine 5'-phosphate oxidase family protein [Catalinimonas alkaloidigena]SDM19498.1 hypothetical protein SAMN05421823_11172 [Catalinimonas alkaloidigena]